jgi:hypothetical protein
MIAFRDDLPLILLGDRRAIAFDSEWLTRVLNVAAHRAGYPNWWLAPHVAQSVHWWLKALNNRPTMPVARFTRAVCEALTAIGYEKIGACFKAASPFARISLVEIAQQAGNGFELAFFTALNRALREAFKSGGGYCELHSLEHCVKILRQRRNWSSGCDELRAEIVAFARSHTAHAFNEPGKTGEHELFLHVA